MAVFSREARSPEYMALRNIMIRTNGTIKIPDALRECEALGLKVDKQAVASARCQYRKFAAAALAAGETIVPPTPVMPTPVSSDKIEEEDIEDEFGEVFSESIESISDSHDEESDWWTDYIPAIDKTYSLPEKTKMVFNVVERLSKKHFAKGIHSSRVRMTGAAGCGKTSAAIQFAALNKRPCFVVDCPTLREPLDLFGTRNVEDMKTIFSESLFMKAVSVPRAVIIFDEMNRIPASVLNIAMPLLDFRGEMWLDLARKNIKVGAGVTMFASLNEGREYTGTEEVDEAIKNRFSTIVECTYLNPKEEANVLSERYGLDNSKALALCEVAKINRDKAMVGEVYTKTISTRLLENAAEMLEGGDFTLLNTIANHFPDDGTGNSERKCILDLLKGKGFKI